MKNSPENLPIYIHFLKKFSHETGRINNVSLFDVTPLNFYGMQKLSSLSKRSFFEFLMFRSESSKIVLFQGSYGIVKLAYNEEDDTHYVSKFKLDITCFKLALNLKHFMSLCEFTDSTDLFKKIYLSSILSF